MVPVVALLLGCCWYELLPHGWWLSTGIRSAAARCLARIGRSAAALRGSAGTRRRAQFWSTSGPVPGTLRWYGPWVRQPLASEKRRILTYFNSEEKRGNTLSQYMLIIILIYNRRSMENLSQRDGGWQHWTLSQCISLALQTSWMLQVCVHVKLRFPETNYITPQNDQRDFNLQVTLMYFSGYLDVLQIKEHQMSDRICWWRLHSYFTRL